jgi:transposase
LFVGIDWASEHHDVCVEDDRGSVVSSFRVGHDAGGFDELVERLARLGGPALRVAIERPDGRLVDRLLEGGYQVVPVSPKAIKAWREAEFSAQAKSDAGDAKVICDYLRLRSAQLRVLEPYSPQTRALRAVVRARDDLVSQRVSVVNQLRATLNAFWPGATMLFASLFSPIALAFLEDYPSPTSASRLGERRMALFLRRHHYTGRRSAPELVRRLRAAPAGIGSGPEVDARQASVLAYVGILRALNAAIAKLETSMAAHLGEHPDAEIFTSLPRSGRITAAQMLAEWGDCRTAYAGPEAVAALAGAVPVTKKSGKYRSVHFRWACNKRFRRAITGLADRSRHSSPWAADVYRRARERGCDHPHAVRVLARAWIRVIYRCWLDRQLYDPAHHGGALRVAAAVRDETDSKAA